MTPQIGLRYAPHVKRVMKTNAPRSLSRALTPFLVAVLGLIPSVATAQFLGGIRIGPPKPVCDQIQRLEAGGLFIEILGPDGEAEYQQVLTGRTDPIILEEGGTYRLGLTIGQGDEARVPARYRVESRSFLTLSAHGVGEEGFPLERKYSWNAYDQIEIYARSAGRRYLYLRVSECYTGGSRFLYAPSETLLPVVVRPPDER